MKPFYHIAYLIVLVFLTSCFKEDEKITPHDPGDVETVAIEMTRDYRYQVYYDLSANQVVATNLKTAWDLGFDCSPEGNRIILNTSNFMLAARSGSTDFSAPIDTAGYVWMFDASSGNPDTVACGGWIEYLPPDSAVSFSQEVYVIDRGYDEAGNLRGFRKIVFESMDDGRYHIRFANLDGTGEGTLEIIKDPMVNFTFFSFDGNGKQLTLEPSKESWDLLFTQYTTLLYTNEGDPYPYLVTGVLTNPMSGVQVAQDTLYPFFDIDIEVGAGMNFSNFPDEIGYDWKDVVGDVSSGNVSYVIVEGLNYVISDPSGYYYKLRFISFYSNTGEKGYPTFEVQRL